MENFKVSFEVKNIHELENSPQNFYAGQVCYDQDNQKLMVYKDSKWIPLNNNAKLNTEGSGIEINLYDLNKNIMSQLKPLSDEKLKELKKLILTFDDTIDNTYYMLLCRERNYYTTFVKNGCIGINAINESVIDCLHDLGEIISGELTEDKTAIEFWIKADDTAYCVYFFGYDAGVVECV